MAYKTTSWKQTEIGKVPSDWDVLKFGKVGVFIRGSGLPKKDFTKSGVGCIHYGQIYTFYGTLVNKTISFVSPNVAKTLNKAAKGDLIITTTSENVEDVCKCVAWLGDNDIVIGGHSSIFKHNEDARYVAYFLSSLPFIMQKKQVARGTKVIEVSAKDLEEFDIIIPSLKEQKQIASVIDNIDELISKLEKLRNKKQAIKVGAMQELLTGKRRLAGFSKQWKDNQLGELAIIKKGEQLNLYAMLGNGEFPVLNGGINFSGYTNKNNACAGTITMSEGGNSCGFVNRIECDFWSGGHCYTIKTNMDTEFLYQLLKLNESNIMKLRVGSGLPNIQKSTLEKYTLTIPSDKKEQIAIGNILSNMDSEIATIEKKINKYRAIKDGVAAELLSGRIRLIPPATR